MEIELDLVRRAARARARARLLLVVLNVAVSSAQVSKPIRE